MSTRTVLQQADITRALTRISHEILESNRGGADLVLLGIPTRGVTIADRLAGILNTIDPGTGFAGALDVTMYRDDLAAQPTRAPSPTVIPAGGIDGKTVVLRRRRALLGPDHSGGPGCAERSWQAAAPCGSAVLVDRGHRELPIRADFVGKNLPTSVAETHPCTSDEIDGADEVTIEG